MARKKTKKASSTNKKKTRASGSDQTDQEQQEGTADGINGETDLASAQVSPKAPATVSVGGGGVGVAPDSPNTTSLRYAAYRSALSKIASASTVDEVDHEDTTEEFRIPSRKRFQAPNLHGEDEKSDNEEEAEDGHSNTGHSHDDGYVEALTFDEIRISRLFDPNKQYDALSGTGDDDLTDEEEYEVDMEEEIVNGGLSENEQSVARRYRVVRRKRRRSLLFRSSDRGDHLRRLFLKRKMRNRLFNAYSRPPRPPRLTSRSASVSADSSLVTMERPDESSYFRVLAAEVERELEKEQMPAKILEVQKLWQEYAGSLNINSLQYPLEVRMKNVNYIVPEESDTKIRTVYNASFLYPIYKSLKRWWLQEPRPERQFHTKKVLNNINLVLKPGTMYLVLGPPGSGKSSLLRAISGLLRPAKDELLEGTISYNGRTLENENEFYIENAFAYIDQLDKHPPRLTVSEIFDFAYQCKSGGKLIHPDDRTQTEAAKEAIEKIHEEKLATQVVLASLGLTEVKDTFVGDTNVRGVSGGQRRRVTVGEMLMSLTPVLCGDEISTGLDAASTYDMVQLILHFGRLRKLTRIFSLLQPSPETVSLFDEIIVVADGGIIYAGPMEQVEDYFGEIGFHAPRFTDVADFLQMVATDDGAQYYDPPEAIRAVRPNAPNAAELAALFQKHQLGQAIMDDLAAPPSFVWSEDESRHGSRRVPVSALSVVDSVNRKYANTFTRSVSLLLKRFLTLWIRDKRVIIAGFAKNIAMGMSCGGVFANTTDVTSLQGALFQGGLFIMLGAMQSASGLVEDRVIFYKHTDAHFYSAWPFVFGRAIAGLPQTTMDTLIFGTIMYYVVGFAGREDFANYCVYICLLLVFAIVMNQQMAVFASFADTSTVQVFAACTILVMMLFCGFIVAPNTIPQYYWCFYWWNPFAWAYRALVVNEFRSGRWEDPDQILESIGFVLPNNGSPFSGSWIGLAFLVLIPYFLLCCVGTALGLTFVRNNGGGRSSPPQDKEDRDARSDSAASEMSFQRVTLSFEDICYEVTASTSKDTLKLLKGVSGIFRAGRMTALMGSSGAGKTTLLDVIALRKRTGTVTGEVRLNGWPQDPISFRRCSGYVEQFSVESPELTVRETILFSARLRLGPGMVENDGQTRAFVDHVMQQVDLYDLAGSLVGDDEGGGLSFEQKKRLSIAVELAASPSVIFLDEPTSGLDSRSALQVVRALRNVANSGRSICATIHQPSSAVFNCFDDLLLLKRGGQVVYNGPLGENCDRIIDYFESRGAQKINLGENPANWMLRVITSEGMGDMHEIYKQSEDFATVKRELATIKAEQREDMKVEYKSRYAVSYWKRQDLVNQRMREIYWRSPAYNLARILVSVSIAVILGSIFVPKYGQDEFEEVDMRARLSVIFLTFIIVGIMAIISVLPVMTKIRDMYYRHADAGMYDSESMGLALGVAEKWFIVLSSALFCLVFLSIADLTSSVRGLIMFWGFFTFNFAIYSYFGQFFVCLVKPAPTALILCSVFIGLNNFFSGLIVRPEFMVGTFFVLPYSITPGRYVYEGLVMSIYFEDSRPVMADLDSDFFNYLNCEAIPCEGTVDDYIDYFFGGEFHRDHTRRNIIILGFVLTLTRVLTWLALRYIRFE